MNTQLMITTHLTLSPLQDKCHLPSISLETPRPHPSLRDPISLVASSWSKAKLNPYTTLNRSRLESRPGTHFKTSPEISPRKRFDLMECGPSEEPDGVLFCDARRLPSRPPAWNSRWSWSSPFPSHDPVPRILSASVSTCRILLDLRS
jgi:hypothetical protein